MAYRYRITQTVEVSVEDEPTFIEWAERIVEPSESEQARVTSGLMRVAARLLTNVPGVRLHDAHTNVHRFERADKAE